jgi:hypothetical protein
MTSEIPKTLETSIYRPKIIHGQIPDIEKGTFMQVGYTRKDEVVAVANHVFISPVTDCELYSNNYGDCIGVLYTGVSLIKEEPNSEKPPIKKRLAFLTHGQPWSLVPLLPNIRTMYNLNKYTQEDLSNNLYEMAGLFFGRPEFLDNSDETRQLIEKTIGIIKKLPIENAVSDEEFYFLENIFIQRHKDYKDLFEERIRELKEKCEAETISCTIVGGSLNEEKDNPQNIYYYDAVRATKGIIQAVDQNRQITYFCRGNKKRDIYFDTPNNILYGSY